MEFIIELSTYMGENWGYLLELTVEHILMVLYGIVLAVIVGVPLGIICARSEKLAPIILSIANIIQIIPSLALLAILMLYFGLGFETVVVGLFLYSLLPIIRNTYVGVKEVDPHVLEAGKGIGMTPLQLLAKIQIPLSLPFMMAGLRIAAVIAVGVASIAPYIGGDGLGREIVSGINGRDEIKIYAGAIPAALLAIIADIGLGISEKRFKKKNA
ncbi:ABC transporter permease [Aquibacillus albus]|uniref:Osmoprotectant transport system permease protein n=1 Tax=Aquibacillus albus TaxID=1168171 RepID=A0ABS2MX94_9BACI|nr:ABC transporter permease [Aquibacillus albus]MBM7570497.1 osmoprotectant transport system permease protein [Aquibacillus albus]